MSLKPGDRIELTVDRLSSGGRGVGRHDGLVVFVAGTAPKERALVEITNTKKSFAEGRMLRVLEASPFRITPLCPVADVCGGCSWQHVDYEEQLRQKRDIVADAFRKFSGRKDIEVRETVPSPNPFHYRTRIQTHFESGRLGFRKRGSHEIVDVSACAISDPKLNAALEKLRGRLNAERSPPTRIELTLNQANEVIESTDPRYQDELGFAQVNQAVNELLIASVLTWIPKETKRVVDLYAGSGNFTFPIARNTRPEGGITAVESHPKSVLHGRDRAKSDSDAAVRFEEARVESFLTSVVEGRHTTLQPADVRDAVVLLDPPRAGCAPEALEAIERLAPRRIIYVSCDPVTLARDLSKFASDKFALLEVRPFDMFPQTDHVETLAVLERHD